jgi:hypothetical protein
MERFTEHECPPLHDAAILALVLRNDANRDRSAGDNEKAMKRAPSPKPEPKFTDEERHKRFVEMAKNVGASGDAKDFDRAFRAVARSRKQKSRPTAKPSG